MSGWRIAVVVIGAFFLAGYFPPPPQMAAGYGYSWRKRA